MSWYKEQIEKLMKEQKKIESEDMLSGTPTIMKNNLSSIVFEPRPKKDGEHHPTVEDVINLVKEVFTSEFKQYKRKEVAELRPVTIEDVEAFKNDQVPHSLRDTEFRVSISAADVRNGSPKIGDMIARNPNNHLDQWLVAEQYFKDNFEEI